MARELGNACGDEVVGVSVGTVAATAAREKKVSWLEAWTES
ncbi:hypothetical protein PA08_2356 [Cutibacterium modestum P08]|nr:hypothetical protein PA08_2356 [Cutibacterium modestum P08]